MGLRLGTFTLGTRALRAAVAIACALAAPSTAVAATPDQVGEWGPVLDFQVPGTHQVLTRNGKVVYWRSSEEARVWDIASGQITPAPAPFPVPGVNFHCAAQVVLADGRVLVVGGQFDGPHTHIPTAAIFDPLTNTWTRVADMHYPRWYPTATVLADGRVLVTTGEGSDGKRVSQAEIYDPRADTWTVVHGADRVQDLYAPNYLLPDGRVFNAAPAASTALLSLETGTWTGGPTPLWRTVGYSETGAMYAPGKILRAGGTTPALAPTNGATNQTAVIDMTSSNPQWEETSPMAFPRRRANMVILADGSVMVVGGTAQGDDAAQAVLASEIWNPATKSWTTVASMSLPRMYHSAALLLPDGRVLSAGGEGSTTSWQEASTAQIYSPPYLFKGPRPTIAGAPGEAGYGGSFTVASPDAASITAVALIRPGAVTHANDMDQRYVPLNFQRGGGALTVAGPANANVAPPGWYMLVIRNSAGAPSRASWIQVGGGFTAGPPPPPGAGPSTDPPPFSPGRSPGGGSGASPSPSPSLPAPQPAQPGTPAQGDGSQQPGGTTARQARRRGEVLSVTLRRRLSHRDARSRGVTASVRLDRWDDGRDRVLRVRLFALRGGRRQLVSKTWRTLSVSTSARIAMRSAALRRLMRPGVYELDAASGTNQWNLRGLVSRRFRVVQ